MENILKIKKETINLELNCYDLYCLLSKNDFKNTLHFSDLLFRELKNQSINSSIISHFDYSTINQNERTNIENLKSKNINLYIRLNEGFESSLFIKKFEKFIFNTILFLHQNHHVADKNNEDYDPFQSSSTVREIKEELILHSILKQIEMFDIEYTIKNNQEKSIKVKI